MFFMSIMGNVRSLPNKMEELTVLTRLQRVYRECSLYMCFTETWLSELSQDSHVTLYRLQLVRADRREGESLCLSTIAGATQDTSV